MTTILAIDTSTDACSVALLREGEIISRHELIPRQHNRRLFSMLEEILPSGKLLEQGVEAIAYGCGPGSFTGLRIAASAVQGLAYANSLPCIPVSTLAAHAQAAFRTGLAAEGATILSLLDARIGEVYAGIYHIEDKLPVAVTAAVAVAPQRVEVPAGITRIVPVGSGLGYLSEFPQSVVDHLLPGFAELIPEARDLIPLAEKYLAEERVQRPEDVAPVYVRDKISWKKLHEQGKPG
jgi:tRNA threonylcarbamoyladenosine biosynthesis protein TsaB